MLDVAYSTGCPSSSGSCSVLVPWSGGVSGLPPRSLPSHPGHQRMQFTPIIRTGVTLCSFCSYIHNPCRPVHSRWLVPLCGMGFRCRKDCFPGFFLTHSTLVSKLFFLAVQGSGALLSSNLEGALYKSP